MSPTEAEDLCRICSGLNHLLALADCRTTKGDIHYLIKCKDCSFISIQPLPLKENLKNYYDASYWQSQQKKKSRLLAALFKLRMNSFIREINRMVCQHSKILDWGTGDGALMYLLRQNGFDCWGIDLYSNTPDDGKLINASIEDASFPDEFFDAITCFHVLEHLENPVQSVQKAFRLLKPGGKLIIEVPNISSLGFRIFKKRWQPLQIPTHMNHFNLQSLKKLCDIIGNNKIIKINYFSNRMSPSALILSIFPFLTPKTMRKKYQGKYPLPCMIVYLLLQILAFPLAKLVALFKKGDIIRIYIKKTAT